MDGSSSMDHTINRTPEEYFGLTEGYLKQLPFMKENGNIMGYATILLGALGTVRKGLKAMELNKTVTEASYARMITQQMQLLQKGLEFMPRFASEASAGDVLELGCELFEAVKRNSDQIKEFLSAQMAAGAVLAKRNLTTATPTSRQMGTQVQPTIVIGTLGPATAPVQA